MTNEEEYKNFEDFKRLDDMSEFLPYLDGKARELQEARIAIETNRILGTFVSKRQIDKKLFLKEFQHIKS